MATVDMFILGIDVVITFLFYRFYKTNKTTALKVKDAPDYEINANLVSKINDSKDQTVPYACVQGPVDAEESPISSSHKPGVQGVIQKLLLKEYRRKRSQGHWSDNSRILRDITNVIPFVIKGVEASVRVTEPKEAEYLLDHLSVVYDHFEPAQSSVFERSFDKLLGDVSKGFKETEKMLIVGTPMTGVGQLSTDRGSVTLSAPKDGALYILSSLTKSEVVKKLEGRAFTYKVLCGIFGVAGAVIALVLLRRYYREWVERRDFNEQLNEIRHHRPGANAAAGDATLLDDDDDDNNRLCIICLTQPREVVLLDCGHICLCADCVELLPLPRKCPVCRDAVARVLPVYMS